MSESQLKRWLADDYRALRTSIDTSYPIGMWIGIAHGRVASVAAYLLNVMQQAKPCDEAGKHTLWVQAGIKHRETLVIQRAFDFDDRWFGYLIGMQTQEELNQAFSEWEESQKRPGYTTEQVLAMLKKQT